MICAQKGLLLKQQVTRKLSPCTKICCTGALLLYTFSIFSGAMYSPWASLKMFFLRSVIFRVPFYRRQREDSVSVSEFPVGGVHGEGGEILL